VELGLGHLDDRGQPRGHADGIAHAAGMGEERLGRARGRQRRAVTVDDGPALGLEHDHPGVLARGLGGQLRVPEELQVRQAGHETSERDGDDRRDDEDARPEAGDFHRKDASTRPC